MIRPRLSVDQRDHLASILEGVLSRAEISGGAAQMALVNFHQQVSAWCEPDWFTLGYTGWRGAVRDRVRDDLTAIRRQLGPMRLIVGFDPKRKTPKGGDLHAYEWGMSAPGVIVECLPPPWRVPELGNSAGPYRNGAIVERVVAAPGSKAMLAHLHPSSRGAAGTAAYAKWRGLDVWKRPAV